MDYQVILSDLFIADLKEIVDYLARRASPEAASRIGNELINRALEIGRNPFVGQIVKDRPIAFQKKLFHDNAAKTYGI